MALPKCGPEWRGGGVLAKRRPLNRTYIAIYIVATVGDLYRPNCDLYRPNCDLNRRNRDLK